MEESDISIYEFGPDKQKLQSIDKLPDLRSGEEQLNSPLSIYNHSNNDLALVERLASEAINISGAYVSVYLRQTHVNGEDDAGDDGVWDEDPDPIYSNSIPIKAYFKPNESLGELTRWGIDSPIKFEIIFSRAQLLNNESIGQRLIVAGDLIKIPYNERPRELEKPVFVRVNASYSTGNYRYRYIYWTIAGEIVNNDPVWLPKHE